MNTMPLPQSPSDESPSGEAGWHADPAGVWAWRWFDGNEWTATVNDGQTNHSDLASLMAVRNNAAPAMGRPSTQAPRAPESSTGRLVKRIVGWGAAAVVGIFALLVVIGLIVGVDPDPIVSTRTADVYGIIDVSGGDSDELWFVVVEPGTEAGGLVEATGDLLALPEASGKRITVTFFDSADELENYIAFNDALINEEGDDIAALIEAAGDFDLEVVKANIVGNVAWSESGGVYAVCAPTTVVCTPDTALVVFPG